MVIWEILFIDDICFFLLVKVEICFFLKCMLLFGIVYDGVCYYV